MVIDSGTIAALKTVQIVAAGAVSYKLSVAANITHWANGAAIGTYRPGVLVEVTNAP